MLVNFTSFILGAAFIHSFNEFGFFLLKIVRLKMALIRVFWLVIYRCVESGCSSLADVYEILYFRGKFSPYFKRENESLMEFLLSLCQPFSTFNVKEIWAICTNLLTSLLIINTFSNCTWDRVMHCWGFFFWVKMFDKLTVGRRCFIFTLNMKIWIRWREGILNSGIRKKSFTYKCEESA